MRLAKIHIFGFKKIVDSEALISGKLTAFVGPNEAGKTSLLEALLCTNTTGPLPRSVKPRGRDVEEDDVAVEVWFRIDGADLAALPEIDHAVGEPDWYIVRKFYDGSLKSFLEPEVSLDDAPRVKALSALQRFTTTRLAREWSRTEDRDGIGDLLDSSISLAGGAQWIEDDQRQVVEEVVSALAASSAASANRAAAAVQHWLSAIPSEHPNETTRKALAKRRPVFAMFGAEQRQLASDYEIGAAAQDPPAALANLASMAGLDLDALAAAVADDLPGTVVSQQEDANDALRRVFLKAWTQQEVVVRLHQDGRTLRIMVSNLEGGYSSIAERSDGLKAFVALTSFAAKEQSGLRPLILLIDEAEQHLHYDAQADLIRMLERQTVALQVLYTTHSAGCLPSDLGTGLRPVLPRAEVAGHSKISSSFWHEGQGFTPLLMAMGASAAAFAPSRYALLAEGATEMLLLPTLIREATGCGRLDYQVAPGIAGSSLQQLADLELQAPRVAYVVDGDDGGTSHAKRLQHVGVPPSSIAVLGGAKSGLVTETLLIPDVYLAAVQEAVLRVHGHPGPTLQELGGVVTPKKVDQWCDRKGLSRVGKPLVASIVLEQDKCPKLTTKGAKALRRLHDEVCSTLRIPPAGDG